MIFGLWCFQLQYVFGEGEGGWGVTELLTFSFVGVLHSLLLREVWSCVYNTLAALKVLLFHCRCESSCVLSVQPSVIDCFTVVFSLIWRRLRFW